MDEIATIAATTRDIMISPLDDLMDRCEQMMQHYWVANPDLWHIVQQRKQKTTTTPL